MYPFHPMVVHFAIAFYVMAMFCEGLALFTHKRFWALVAKYNLGASAIAAFVTMITGFVDYAYTWMIGYGYIYLKAHMIMGVVFFIFVQLQANYRFIIHKFLPPMAFTAYLVMGGIGIGLLMGTAALGKTGVFQYGTGVDVVMLKRYRMEEYLKRLYRLDTLPNPTAEDSVFANQILLEGGSLDTLAQNPDETGLNYHEVDSEPTEEHKNPNSH